MGIIGAGAMGSRITRAFAQMGEVERLIKVHWPEGGEPRCAFLLARPTEPVQSAPELLTVHVAELFERMRLGASQTPQWWKALGRLTRAETIGLFVEASLRHPLQQDDARVYEMLFAELYPQHVARVGIQVLTGRARDETKRAVAEWLARESPERVQWIKEMRVRAR